MQRLLSLSFRRNVLLAAPDLEILDKGGLLFIVGASLLGDIAVITHTSPPRSSFSHMKTGFIMLRIDQAFARIKALLSDNCASYRRDWTCRAHTICEVHLFWCSINRMVVIKVWINKLLKVLFGALLLGHGHIFANPLFLSIIVSFASLLRIIVLKVMIANRFYGRLLFANSFWLFRYGSAPLVCLAWKIAKVLGIFMVWGRRCWVFNRWVLHKLSLLLLHLRADHILVLKSCLSFGFFIFGSILRFNKSLLGVSSYRR